MNGSYRGNDPIGRLMHDFACKDAKNIYYSELRDGVRHFKEKGGRKNMCQAVEEYAARVAEEAAAKAAEEAAIKATIEDAISYGMEKKQIVAKVCDKYGLSENEADELYNSYVRPGQK